MLRRNWKQLIHDVTYTFFSHASGTYERIPHSHKNIKNLALRKFQSSYDDRTWIWWSMIGRRLIDDRRPDFE